MNIPEIIILFAIAIFCIVIFFACAHATLEWIRHKNNIDGYFALSAILAVIHIILFIFNIKYGFWNNHTLLRLLLYQLLICFYMLFFLASARVLGKITTLLVWAHYLVASLFVLFSFLSANEGYYFAIFWIFGNIISWAMFLACGIRKIILKAIDNALLVIVSAVYGIGTFFNDVLSNGHETRNVMTHAMFSCVTILTWLIATNRIFSGMGSEAIKKHAAAMERKKLAEDLHDGVGSHLVSLLSSLYLRPTDQTQLVFTLEQCLLDLKIIVDDMAHGAEKKTVVDLLASLRYRLEPCLQRLQIHLVWELEPSNELDTLQDLHALEVIKAMQEAIANAIHHAKASWIRISAAFVPEENCALFQVEDNGVVFCPASQEPTRVGKGMANMARRIERVKGHFEVTSSPGNGCMVAIMVPLHGKLEPVWEHSRLQKNLH